MVYYVRMRMKLSLVCTTSLLIRGSRNHQGHCWRKPPEGAAMSDWQTWQLAGESLDGHTLIHVALILQQAYCYLLVYGDCCCYLSSLSLK